MRRFRVLTEQIQDGKVLIIDTDARHIAKVLRLEPGSQISVFDGTGNEYQVELTEVSNNSVEGIVVTEVAQNREAPIKITLLQGLPKQAKMEVIVQKCTELGVAKIAPIITERTVVNWDVEKGAKKTTRWQKVAQEACKQCGRQVVPTIEEPKKLQEVLNNISANALFLIPWESEEATGIKEVLKKVSEDTFNEVYIAIGPEGGFSRREIDAAIAKGAIPVTLGKRILRTETAGMAAVTIVLYELGDLGGKL
ncbi:16S rRNA (uracil1498-N3)-methyltransferase [Desulfitispora alkaliphila]|uniref:16S rRNA (uracil(1498)-N(3))-methyltransferase n=1 Tax=Desulfitispora alkaliphila TaxID=622674 RepID=UPI003D1A5564